ncbi:hypothetical protein PMAYCL1PPCAC_05228, partial [Pristionchus mayeri]
MQNFAFFTLHSIRKFIIYIYNSKFRMVHYGFMPTMLQGPEYNCSSVMPPGPAWAAQYGVKQYRFGIYSVVFGFIAEILYLPCVLALRRELKTSCFKIMYWLAIQDMICLTCSCILFGVLLIEGAVYCSHRVLSFITGSVSYWIWCTASPCCVVLALNRLCEMINLSRFFSATRTNVYLGICASYGTFMVLFTRPALGVNSSLQAIIFSPLIPGHDQEEYANWPHAVHNIAVAAASSMIYVTLIVVIVIKSVLYTT